MNHLEEAFYNKVFELTLTAGKTVDEACEAAAKALASRRAALAPQTVEKST